MTALASVQTAADAAPLDLTTVLLMIGALALLVVAVGGLAMFFPPADDEEAKP